MQKYEKPLSAAIALGGKRLKNVLLFSTSQKIWISFFLFILCSLGCPSGYLNYPAREQRIRIGNAIAHYTLLSSARASYFDCKRASNFPIHKVIRARCCDDIPTVISHNLNFNFRANR